MNYCVGNYKRCALLWYLPSYEGYDTNEIIAKVRNVLIIKNLNHKKRFRLRKQRRKIGDYCTRKW